MELHPCHKRHRVSRHPAGALKSRLLLSTLENFSLYRTQTLSLPSCLLIGIFGRSLLSQGLGPEASERARERERHSRERHMAREARIPAETCPRSLQPGRAAISAHSRGLGKCSKRETEGDWESE